MTSPRPPFPRNAGPDDLFVVPSHPGCSAILNTGSKEKYEKGSTLKPDVKSLHEARSENVAAMRNTLEFNFWPTKHSA